MTTSDAANSPGRWSDLERPPLAGGALERGLVTPGGLWSSVRVVQSTGSTNTDLAAAGPELPEGAVLVAEEQNAGRGRLDRAWTAPARSGIFVSVLLKPGAAVPEERWAWLTLLAGVAASEALSRTAGVAVALKWPNDLLVDVEGEERKLGGILAERTVDGVVLGLGINVSLSAAELPVPGAGSLLLAKAEVTDRDPLLRSLLRSLERWYGRWREAAGDPIDSGLMEAYTAVCATLGREVRADLPGGTQWRGTAEAVDSDGGLVVRAESGERRVVGAGDVIHLRPAAD
ncbi:biotin--[acetyl-CoA-carboxylase] ligase [Streptomyces sp. BI20]|uniref:biotin--[acetyl-CoA-carboxylase] ligase n=1 Tax=Streptomyces sp. BI20 TaxID=3403460 RepID=UPI003C7345E8